MRVAGVLLAVLLLGSVAAAAEVIDKAFIVASESNDWQGTGIQIEANDQIYLFGRGAVFYGNATDIANTACELSQPGDSASYAPAPNIWALGLVGKIGGGSPFVVGALGRQQATATGELFLGYNDIGSHSDNTGGFMVWILVLRDFTTYVSEGRRIPASPEMSLKAGPNPTESRLNLSYTLPRDGQVRLCVYDRSGRLITTLVDRRVAAGPHQANWDGVARDGTRAPAGTYFYELSLDGARATRQSVMVR